MTQSQIPGTERNAIPELDEKAEAYRQTVSARLKLQAKEKEQKALLLVELEQQAKAGNLTVDPEADDDVLHDVYLYEGEDGERYRIRVKKSADVKVNKAPRDE